MCIRKVDVVGRLESCYKSKWTWCFELIPLFCFIVKRAADEVSSEAKKPRIEVN